MHLEPSNTFTDYAKSNLAVLKIDKEHACLWERVCEIVSR